MSDTIISVLIIVGSVFAGFGYFWLDKWFDRRQEAKWEAEIAEIMSRRNSDD